jgi:Tfp pilus assembly protein PilV
MKSRGPCFPPTSRRERIPAPERLRSRSGFGLAETLVTVVICGTAFLGLVSTSTRVGSAMNSTHERTRALAVAQAQMETLLSVEYDELVDGTAEVEGVRLVWRVRETDALKEIELTFGYTVADKTLTGSLTAGRLKP